MSLYIHVPAKTPLLTCLSFVECNLYGFLLKLPTFRGEKHTSTLRNVDLWTRVVFIFLVNLGGILISYKTAIDLTGLQDILLYFEIIWYYKRIFPLLFFFTMVIHFPVSNFFSFFLELGKLSENKNKKEEIILEKVALGHPQVFPIHHNVGFISYPTEVEFAECFLDYHEALL